MSCESLDYIQIFLNKLKNTNYIEILLKWLNYSIKINLAMFVE